MNGINAMSERNEGNFSFSFSPNQGDGDGMLRKEGIMMACTGWMDGFPRPILQCDDCLFMGHVSGSSMGSKVE